MDNVARGLDEGDIILQARMNRGEGSGGPRRPARPAPGGWMYEHHGDQGDLYRQKAFQKNPVSAALAVENVTGQRIPYAEVASPPSSPKQ